VYIDKTDGREYVFEQENVYFDHSSMKYSHAGTNKIINRYKPKK
jgi:hypothetical protein